MTKDGHRSAIVRHDLDTIDDDGGVVWSLPHDGDLDGNLVRLRDGHRIDEHVNDDVDVLIVGRDGSGTLTVDDDRHEIGASTVVLVPSGRRRSMTAGPNGLAYLSVHRRRGPMMP